MDCSDYDEARLGEQLEGLPRRLRVAFAAACAERLYRVYAPHEETAYYGEPGELSGLLRQLWHECESGELTSDWVERITMRVAEVIPHDDDVLCGLGHDWLNSFAYALVYALDTHRTGDARVAVWAAMKSYDTLSAVVAGRRGFDPYAPGAKELIRRDPLVQGEVARQRRDLEELQRGPECARVIRRIHARATHEGTLLAERVDE